MFLDPLFPLLLISVVFSYCNGEASENNEVWTPFDPSSTLSPCGQYGFRCIDSKSFQICPYRDAEGTTEKAGIYHECKDGFVCDEDNPAYCTPIDPLLPTTEGSKEEEKENVDFYDPESFGFIAEYPEEVESPLIVEHREVRSPEHETEKCECISTTTTTEPSTSTTTTEASDSSDFDITPSAPLSCDNYGFYPDSYNKTLFWFCDVPKSGIGYYIRHMKCGEGRYFDSLKHACVLEGTVRDVRENEENPENDEELEGSNSQFSCSGKRPGKYADDKNCQLYHVCLTKIFQPFNELLFSCPDETAFDPSTQRCSRLATYRCLDKDGAMEQVIPKENPKIQCEDPSRFRELSDCSSYYLCYGDQLLEMKCPEFYRFDDNILECLPKGIARCTEIIE